MDGNFIDNSLEDLIESADIQTEKYTDTTEKSLARSMLEKYDRFALRIKFNHGLDPHSVRGENAIVSSGSKKVGTSVEYDKDKRSIIISPKNKYLRNTLYILKLSGTVMSEKGRSLRKNSFYVFRQDGKSLSFYKGGSAAAYGESAPDFLHVHKSMLLPLLFAASASILTGSYFLASKAGMAIGAALVLLATLAAFIDSISDSGKSHKEYVYGAKLYNDGFFFEAVECFELALHYNPNNLYARRGLDAAIIKCSEAVD